MNSSGPLTADQNQERVYLDYYNLTEAPFAITPDPEYLFCSTTHQNAINKLLYGINSRMGFLLLVGEVGTGKTTICRCLLDNLAAKASTVYIINPSLSGTELIASILDDLGIDYPADASKKDLIDALNRFLLSSGNEQPVVVIIDDAQTVHTDSLEDLRLLSNLETDKDKLLQILLVGQPELLVQLSRPEMRQLKQRVALTCRLDFLAKNEIGGYISRRLFVSGDKGRIQFKSDAVNRIFNRSKGIPRLINRICDYALTAGYVADSHEIDQQHVKKAVQELKDLGENTTVSTTTGTSTRKWIVILLILSLVYTGIVVVVWRLAPQLVPGTAGVISPPKPQPKPMPIAQASPQASQLATTLKETLPPAPADITPSTPSDGVTPVSTESTSTKPSVMPAESNTPDDDYYVVRVASFRTMQRVEKATAQLSRLGIQSYWKFMDLGPKGQWYGVYTGRFKTLDEAKQFRMEKQLFDAIIEHRYGESP
jgi:general secretion pathway protein A